MIFKKSSLGINVSQRTVLTPLSHIQGRDDIRYFRVHAVGKSGENRVYAVRGHKNTTLETVWASQKCFFTPGVNVKITDDEGISKVFTA